MNDLEITVVPKDDAEDFRTILKEQDIEYSERTSIQGFGESDGVVTLLGEFTIMAKVLGPAAISAIGAWFVARQGRKLRVKMGDIEAEAGSIEEVKELLALAHKQSAEHAKREDEGKNPPRC